MGWSTRIQGCPWQESRFKIIGQIGYIHIFCTNFARGPCCRISFPQPFPLWGCQPPKVPTKAAAPATLDGDTKDLSHDRLLHKYIRGPSKDSFEEKPPLPDSFVAVFFASGKYQDRARAAVSLPHVLHLKPPKTIYQVIGP